MRRARTKKQVRLDAYRELYSAICGLSESLYAEALTVASDERDAAFAASCELVGRLQKERTPSKHKLLDRLDGLSFGAPRKARAASQTP